MQLVIMKDDCAYTLQNIEDMAPLVRNYMGEDAYYFFRDYLDKVEEMVDFITTHITKLKTVNDMVDSLTLDNLTYEAEEWLEGLDEIL